MARPEFPLPALYGDRRVIPYLTAIGDRYRYLHMLGLPDPGDRAEVPLQRLYVEPRLGGPLAADVSEEALTRDGESVTAAISRLRQLAILGEAGMGKSTLVASLILGLAQRGDTWVQQELGPLLPLPVVLRELNLSAFHAKPGWAPLLAAALRTLPGAEGLAEALPELLKAGQVLVLVDGWDEVSPATREGLCAALEELRALAPEARLVVTSRPLGWTEGPCPRGNQLESLGADLPEELHLLRDATLRARGPSALPELWVRPFRLTQIETFVERWFALRISDEQRRAELRAGVLDALRPMGSLRQLARVPNLLALMCLVYRVYVHLPSGRGQLYEKIAEAYLESIPVAAGLAGLREVPLAQKQRWLGLIARTLQLRRANAMGPEEAGTRISRAEAEALIAGKGGAGPERAKHFLAFAAARAGLLLPLTDGQLGFAHLSFQEYFAAYDVVADLQAGFLAPEAAGVALADLRNLAAADAGHETVVVAFELLGRHPGVADRLYASLSGQEGLPVALIAELYYDTATGLSEETRVVLEGRIQGELRALVEKTGRGMLDLPRWARTLEQVVSIEQPSACTALFLGRTQVSRLDWLPAFPRLTHIGLAAGQVSDLGPVLQHPTLTSIGLSGGSEDLTRYATGRFTTLHVLAEGGGSISLSGLERWPYLTEVLVVGGLGLDWDTLASCPGLKDLTLMACRSVDLAQLGRLARVTQCNVLGCADAVVSTPVPSAALRQVMLYNVSATTLGMLPRLSTLEQVTIFSSDISTLAPLGELPRLKRLIISECRVTDLAGLNRRKGLVFQYIPTPEPNPNPKPNPKRKLKPRRKRAAKA